MKTFNKYLTGILSFFLISLGLPAFAQDNAQEIEMADQLRAEGKIYVVVAVLTVILIGILIFLIMLDRKIGRLEKQVKA